MRKKLFIIVLLLFPLSVFAHDSNITSKCEIRINNKSYKEILDDDFKTYKSFKKNQKLKINCSENINSIYIKYNEKSTTGKINNKQKIGENKYLHELIKSNNKSQSLNIKYDDNYQISDIYVFNSDDYPEWVENWKTLKKADLMLFSTHSDDEHLWFAGLLPTYVDRGYNIQVVYFTNHYDDKKRYHELLEGLWAVGIKYYPVMSHMPDKWSTTLKGAIKNLKKAGYSIDDAITFNVKQIRKYKPLVVVTHDEKGEYGHGQHKLCSKTVKIAVKKAFDNTYNKKSYNKYGKWKIKKLYIHLYKKNKIKLNIDKPLKSFDNKTGYEVSKIGFSKHKSQYDGFKDWLNGENNEYTKATQITDYSPVQYGLYYSSVGKDKKKNDMFENIGK